MDLAEIKVYRMIHIDNIPHVLHHGITLKSSPNKNSKFITIGDTSLIDTRNNKQVSVDNGTSSSYVTPLITLGDFIPFYFGVRMPMLYVIQHGGNFVERATPAINIIYLVCSVSSIVKYSKDYYFSDGHATDSLTTFYDKSKITDLPNIIDWNAIKAPYWSGQENLNIKRKKQAEFLVSCDLPANLIVGFGCYNETAKNKLINLGILKEKIKVIPNAYY
ncbi:DUF4433 domain-containing protein [uncultured Mucilaginibacter sp.]|uniref:type II toxin-antitoxin system toxin DNA ADP-ribosyl transferase DarT n=1 Tax=uncultured Mucilaginibacter sp. TaxID=797541 RepID=UPI002610CD1B|nr:DUF4433 domain-containing protein [uncultured Mucilaginibacter sp.]